MVIFNILSETHVIIKLLFYISMVMIAFSSFKVCSSFDPFLKVDHLTEAILETHFAINASDVKAIIQHAEKAKSHAVATKHDVYQLVDHQLLDNGELLSI
jgi:hypothetical protein